jgi:hypothetical protein
VRISSFQSCARAASRLPRGSPRGDPEWPDRPLSRRRRLRPARARPCERRRRLVQQPVPQPRPQASSLRARPDQQRTAAVSHRRHRAHREQTTEPERWHHVVDHQTEPPLRIRPRPAQHSPLPTLRPGGDRIRSAIAGMSRRQPPTPTAGPTCLRGAAKYRQQFPAGRPILAAESESGCRRGLECPGQYRRSARWAPA